MLQRVCRVVALSGQVADPVAVQHPRSSSVHQRTPRTNTMISTLVAADAASGNLFQRIIDWSIPIGSYQLHVQLVGPDGDGPVDDPLEEIAARGVRGDESADHGVRPRCSLVHGRTPGMLHRNGIRDLTAQGDHTAYPLKHVLPTIRTFTVGPGVSPDQPLAGCERVVDCHHRFGIAPTPEHVRPVCNNRGGMPRARPCAAGHPTPPHRHGHTSQPTTPIPVVRCEICR